ncbi:MAG TPA: histidine phosphatase family protein [Acidimicrobiales bacterium]|nr:histidine phosphatase family protein [Acidimicrobiales bacterium]
MGLIVVRHALSTWNMDGRWQGQADPPLAAQGEAQARAAAAAVGSVDLVVTSDLERARRTGALLAPGVAAREVRELREFDVGAWSGLTRAQIEAEWPGEVALFDAGRLSAPPGGEPRAAFEARVGTAARVVAGLVGETGAARTLVVTHGGVIRIWARIQGRPDAHVAHLCGYEAEDKGGTVVLLTPVDLRPAPPGRPGPPPEPAY